MNVHYLVFIKSGEPEGVFSAFYMLNSDFTKETYKIYNRK